jgi:hypothetical protein
VLRSRPLSGGADAAERHARGSAAPEFETRFTTVRQRGAGDGFEQPAVGSRPGAAIRATIAAVPR